MGQGVPIRFGASGVAEGADNAVDDSEVDEDLRDIETAVSALKHFLLQKGISFVQVAEDPVKLASAVEPAFIQTPEETTAPPAKDLAQEGEGPFIQDGEEASLLERFVYLGGNQQTTKSSTQTQTR